MFAVELQGDGERALFLDSRDVYDLRCFIVAALDPVACEGVLSKRDEAVILDADNFRTLGIAVIGMAYGQVKIVSQLDPIPIIGIRTDYRFIGDFVKI